MKEYRRTSILLIYFLSFIYMEFMYRILLYKKVFILSNINMILFVLCYSLVMYLITRISGNKINKTILYVTLIFWAIWFSAQYVVKGFFDFYISFSILQIADQVTSFFGKAVVETIKRIGGITLLFLPVILCFIFKNKIHFNKITKPKLLITIGALVLSIFCFIGSLNINKNEDYSPYELFYNINNPSLNIEKVGIINTFFVDIYRVIFGFNEKLIISSTPKIDTPKEIIYDPNNLNIDLNALLNDYQNNNQIASMTNYFLNDDGTYQNKYTGMFKGKNLILFMAESFNEIAITKETTPTLYKLANSGFVFNNYYTPTIYSTIGGEFQELSGLYANFSSLSKFRSGSNSFPMGIANLFSNEGYNTYAYHNNSYAFQDRNVYLKTLGFNNFKACFNGLEKLITCSGIWPQSDVEMINATVDDYINSDKPFMVFYATVSGHASYNFTSNSMAKKHKDEIMQYNFNYSEPVLAYMAAQMELDDALESLINKLEAAGKLDDTIIALVGDHYPYELTASQVNEAASYVKDDKIEINHSKFILWNNKMDRINIEKVGSQIDVMPTLYNLFNLPYDSRLMIGKDILSTEPGLAMFDNRSWVSDKGKYFTATGEFIPNNGVQVNDDYVSTMNQIVNNKINISAYIIDNNYYKIAWNYLK